MLKLFLNVKRGLQAMNHTNEISDLFLRELKWNYFSKKCCKIMKNARSVFNYINKYSEPTLSVSSFLASWKINFIFGKYFFLHVIHSSLSARSIWFNADSFGWLTMRWRREPKFWAYKLRVPTIFWVNSFIKDKHLKIK